MLDIVFLLESEILDAHAAFSKIGGFGARIKNVGSTHIMM
jgi:hypothetical protein